MSNEEFSLPLASMTGFGRASGELHNQRWTWEAKSVNGRSLDVRIKVPFSYGRIELPAKKVAAKYLDRGSVSITLSIESDHTNNVIRINRPLLDELIALHREISGGVSDAPSGIETLLTIKGVVEVAEPINSQVQAELMDAALLSTLDEAIKKLVDSRRAEGKQISTLLDKFLSTLEGLCRKALQSDGAQVCSIRSQLEEQIARLLDCPQEISADRLAQEVALLATKADVREELDRLETHCAAGRELLAKKEPIGRRLDFLCQEFNREANTLCSKSASKKLTRIGLEMKATIDQLREQVQNVE